MADMTKHDTSNMKNIENQNTKGKLPFPKTIHRSWKWHCAYIIIIIVILITIMTEGHWHTCFNNNAADTNTSSNNVTVSDGSCDDTENANGVNDGCDDTNVTGDVQQSTDATYGYDITDAQASFITEVTTKDVLSAINDGYAFVALFGYSKCPDCQRAVPVLMESAEEHGVSVKYVNTRSNPEWNSNTDIDDYDKLCDVIGDYLPKDTDGAPHLQVPTVVFVKNGVIEKVVQEGDAKDTDEQCSLYDAGFDSISNSISN